MHTFKSMFTEQFFPYGIGFIGVFVIAAIRLFTDISFGLDAFFAVLLLLYFGYIYRISKFDPDNPWSRFHKFILILIFIMESLNILRFLLSLIL